MQYPLIIGSNGHVAAIHPTEGRELWRTKLQHGVFTATGGQDVSVLVQDEFVFAGSNGMLFCLSHATGQILWSNELKGMGYNDVSLAVQGTSVQYLQKVVRQSNSNAS